MEKSDARKLKPEVQQQLRYQAARLFKKGWKNQKIAEALGVSHVSVCRWHSTYTQHGSKGFKLEKDYPDIAVSAKAEKAEIHLGDENGFANNCQHDRSYSLCGKTPVLRLPAKKERISDELIKPAIFRESVY